METLRKSKRKAENMKFKSYYVVWKLFFQPQNRTVFFCLNRTMQYGNSQYRKIAYPASVQFKSYYVVWKQYFEISKHTKFDDGLNRTMQYGNFPKK